MQRQFSFVLVGNALALMVAAIRLARDGADIAIVNPTKNWGGHFSTFMANGVPFDAGMVLHEFTSFNSESRGADPASYDPAIRNDAGRFCANVQRFVDGYQQTHAIPTPKMYIDDCVLDDLLIANSLSSLRKLPFAEHCAQDLRHLADAGALHASKKLGSTAFIDIDYESASLANHGETFHARLIEPFCQKLLNIPTRDMLALYHRIAWLPLYYPETLLSHLHGIPQALPPTVFSYPTGERIGDLATKLKTEIEGNARITVIQDGLASLRLAVPGRTALTLGNGDVISAAKVAWANTLKELLRAIGLEQRAATYQKGSIALAFLRLPATMLRLDFSVLSVVDSRFAIYRITNQSRCAGQDAGTVDIVVELNPDYAASRETYHGTSDIAPRIARELLELGIITGSGEIEWLAVKQMPNALMLPTRGNRTAFMGEQAAVLDAVSGVSLLGPASGFFSSSFNDQIVQGLKFGMLQERLP
jgi:hypothetical protein